MDRNEVICNCNDVTYGQIVDAVKEKKLTSVEEVQDATEAGTVCGGCIDDIQEILDEING